MRHPLKVWDKNARRLFFMAIAIGLGFIYFLYMVFSSLS